MPPLIFRKGLDLKHEVAGVLNESYHSDLIDEIKEADFRYSAGRLTIHLAREFGFCYGVDRAVDYAYQARRRFPDRIVYLTGEIIHNPHVNNELRAQGIRFLSDRGESLEKLTPDDVVILPAFGVTIELLADLQEQGCTLVDTTCGSVLNVWKNVKRYAEQGFTSIVHGKYWHEETRATVSQALHAGNGQSGHYIVVLDRDQATIVCDYVRSGGSRTEFLARFEQATSPEFEPERDLQRVGCANQTTMLSSESLQIGNMFQSAMRDRYGEVALPRHFRAFDTICSATQDRQDAVLALLTEQPVDLMVVIGGLNSSNTCNLARICADKVPTFHLADADGLISAGAIRHKPVGGPSVITSSAWLPPGDVCIGLTSGASTPDNLVGAVIRRLALITNGA